MLIDKVGHVFLFLISKICFPGSLFLFKEQFDTFDTFKIMYQNDTLCVFFIRKKNDITLGDQVSSQKERQLCLYFSSPRRDCQRLGSQPNGVIWLLKLYFFSMPICFGMMQTLCINAVSVDLRVSRISAIQWPDYHLQGRQLRRHLSALQSIIWPLDGD